jgi:hypothetical protein
MQLCSLNPNVFLIDEWLVFSRAAASGAYGLVKSKKSGIWWARASNKLAAQDVQTRIGPSAWIVDGVLRVEFGSTGQ